MRLLKKSMAILMTAVMVTTMTPVTAEAASKKYVKSLTLSKKSITIEAGKTGTIKATVKVKGNVSKKVKVSLSKANKKVVKKVKVGKPNSKGVSKITFTAADVEKKASTTVKVVTAKKNSKGKKITKKVKVTVTPKKATEATTTEAPTPEATTTEAPTPETPTPETPTTEAPVYLSYEGYELDWADEFTGTELNRDNWNVELHEPGWVNAELQEYVDSEENIYIEDGKLVLNPVQTKNEDGTYSYTSGRVNTQNKKTYTYGMFEVKAKVPEGMGYLPAFWLMANDENVYGQWPRCGEIDIMEVMGQNTKKAMGTIHYGNPHQEQQGSYVLENGSFSDEYHTFTCEWEPGKITWYVDGVKFHEANDWYSATEGGATISYPAPFDQPFYIILNLAVGGSWVGYPDDATFQAQPYMIDYVRVYQKEGGYDDSNVIAPEKEAVVIRDADATGNYLINGDFSDAEDLVEAKDWQFKTANEGVGTTDLSAGNATVKTTNDGNVDYSIQLVQNDVPLIAGQTYVLSYDAYASADRKMKVASKAPNNSWYAYLEKEVSLTTTKQTFTHEFTMVHTDDANCTVEFNMGNFDSTDTIVIDNVSLKLKSGKIDEAAREAINNPPKSVRADGNHIYNGEFQEGDKKLGYWTIPAGADVSVTSLADGRRLKVVVPKDGKVTISQDGIPVVAESAYELSLDAEVPTTGSIAVGFDGQTYTVPAGTDGSWTQKFATSAGMEDNTITITFNGAGTYYLDNVRLVEDVLIKNGSFNAGFSGYETFADTSVSSKVSWVVDSLNESNAADITINDTGTQDWHIQLKQSSVDLEKDQWYKLSFKIKSSKDRSVSYAIQRDGNRTETKDDWTPYVQEVINISSDYSLIEKEFKMGYDTDLESVFNITMGAVGGTQITDQHRICIDDIVLEKIEEPDDAPVIVPVDFTFSDVSLVKTKDAEGNAVTDSANLLADGTWNGNPTVEDDGTMKITVADPGANPWDKQLQKTGINLEKGCSYEISFKASASVARPIEVILQKNGGDYAVYNVANNNNPTVALTDTVKLYKLSFTMNAETDAAAAFNFNLGNVTSKDDTLEGEEVTDEETPTPGEGEEGGTTETPNEPVVGEQIVNGDFADGKDSWTDNCGVAWVDAVASATYTTEGAVFDIDNVGTANWHIQLKQGGLSLVTSEQYTVEIVVESAVSRSVEWGFFGDIEGNNCAISETVEVQANTPTTITKTFTPEKDAAAFILSLGKVGDNCPAGKVTIKSVSVKMVEDDNETPEVPEVPVNSEMIVNGDFANGKESWTDNCGVAWVTAVASVAYTADGAEFDITNVGDQNWHIQLKQGELSLLSGKQYTVEIVAESAVSRSIEWGFFGDIEGGNCAISETVDLEANTPTTITKTFTLEQDATAFILSLGKVGTGDCPAGTVTVKSVSLKVAE